MSFEEIVLDGFHGREEALSEIKRYTPFASVMYYRTNNLIHSRRVLWHLEAAVPDILGAFGSEFDVEFARTLASVHDDAEILTGDAQLYDKERMSAEELSNLEAEEIDATYMLATVSPKYVNGFSYLDLLLTAKKKDRLESQMVSFFDKFDAAGEAWHEVAAGNKRFLRPAGGIPGEGDYVRRLNEFPLKYSALVPFFERTPEYLPEPFDFVSLAERGILHTEPSLSFGSEYFPYEMWKRTVMEREGTKILTTQVEFDD
ncbi:MAG: HD domain-containing protein [Nanoarchaeota archaeon]|nr:HD domain-containing protein [Nanoarchaeota archaeon]